ncbi:MAG: cbb3-type cytochrome c oxidase subunit I, partial [Verrucomicrobiota bacterium]
AFWLLVIIGGWTGFSRFYGGPFASSIPAISGAASILLVLVAVVTGANFYSTLKGRFKLLNYSPSLKFTFFGLIMMLAYFILAAMMQIPSWSKTLQFSLFTSGLDTFAVYGFFSMSLFGAIYFIVPRVAGAEWPSAGAIEKHFLFSVYGIATLVLLFLVGGKAQGDNMLLLDAPFSTGFTNSVAYIVGGCIAWILIGFSNLWFFYQLLVIFLGKGRKSAGPTLMHGKTGAASAEEAAGIA